MKSKVAELLERYGYSRMQSQPNTTFGTGGANAILFQFQLLTASGRRRAMAPRFSAAPAARRVCDG